MTEKALFLENLMKTTIRNPVMAGSFYPGDREALTSELADLLNNEATTNPRQPKAIIVPHAGYTYSGRTAAAVYSRLKPWRHIIQRVVLLGPSHRAPVRCVAIPSVTAFATPLQPVPLDNESMEMLATLPQVIINDAAHASEHSLEVQLPFLQTVLDSFSLVPMVVGHAAPEDVRQILDAVWGGNETLIVVSSDLSHFLPYASAKVRDRLTCNSILDCDPKITPEEACGAFPINGLLLTANQHQLRPELVALCNSGDSSGDKNCVVGYASFAFYPQNTAQHA